MRGRGGTKEARFSMEGKEWGIDLSAAMSQKNIQYAFHQEAVLRCYIKTYIIGLCSETAEVPGVESGRPAEFF